MPVAKQAPAYVVDGEWRQDLGPVRQTYTAEQAAMILRCRIVQVEAMDNLTGPLTTLVKPVDHDRLVTLLDERRRRYQRAVARRELVAAMDATLTAAGMPATRKPR